MLTVGQKVRVKSSLVAGKRYDGCSFRSEMNQYKGREFVIEKETLTNRYKLDGAGSWSYTEEMLTTIESEADALTIKVGDTVKIVETTEEDRSLGIIVGKTYLVSDIEHGEDVFINAPRRARRYMTSDQYVKVTTKTGFTFAEVVQMLADKELEEGQELINDRNTFKVWDYCGDLVLRELTEIPRLYSGMIHKPWTLVVPEPEPEIEMTVAEIQEKLGHKVKIVDKTN